ncbi:uncharacterized protein AB9W97_018452 [Spinachia spinachia]
MNVPALVLLFGLVAMVCSRNVCGPGCKHTTKFCQPDFKHVSDLRHSSVAPWKLRLNETEGREPAIIPYADCTSCNVENMIAKPIVLQISVYHVVRWDNHNTWCKCPFNLAVGCTCVSKQ